eukprot:10941890-Alexandrium_andersonii.AAC.1
MQSKGAAVPAHPPGQTALSVASNRRKPETPLPHCQAQNAPRLARRRLHLDLRNEGLRLWPIRSRAVLPVAEG